MKFVTKGLSGIPDGTPLTKEDNGSLTATVQSSTFGEGGTISVTVVIPETATNFKAFVDEVDDAPAPAEEKTDSAEAP